MEKIFAKAAEMLLLLKEYICTCINLAKLHTVEKTSKFAANLIAGVIVFFVLLFFIIFASIGFVYLLARWTGELYFGFFIVSVVYLLLAILLWRTREKWLRIPIMKELKKQLFKEGKIKKKYD